MTQAVAASPAMTIGGPPIDAAARFGVVTPATGRVYAGAPDCTREQLDEAMNAALAAAASWRADEDARRAALLAAARAARARQEELAATLSGEQGKPLKAAAFEVAETARWLSASAELEIPRAIVQDDARGYAEV